MATTLLVCGSKCKHDHKSLNSPSGCCEKHGPYLYYCKECHERQKMTNEPEFRTYSWRLSLKKNSWHLWDTTTFNSEGLPVAACRSDLALFPMSPTSVSFDFDTFLEKPECKRCVKIWES